MCKPGNRLTLMLGLMLLSGVASATDCDGTRVGELTRQTVEVAEVCLVTIQQSGVTFGGQSVECQAAHYTSLLQNAEVERMRAAGCTTYYNGPSKATVRRLGELGDLFAAAAHR